MHEEKLLPFLQNSRELGNCQGSVSLCTDLLCVLEVTVLFTPHSADSRARFLYGVLGQCSPVWVALRLSL